MTSAPFEIRVACHAGYRGEEEPRRLWLKDRSVEVADITDRWLAPDHRYFKVLGEDGCTYIIRHDTRADRWELTLFDRTGTTPLR
jgi:hypothetical protein